LSTNGKKVLLEIFSYFLIKWKKIVLVWKAPIFRFEFIYFWIPKTNIKIAVYLNGLSNSFQTPHSSMTSVSCLAQSFIPTIDASSHQGIRAGGYHIRSTFTTNQVKSLKKVRVITPLLPSSSVFHSVCSAPFSVCVSLFQL